MRRPNRATIARSASGALEIVPWVRVVNLSRALEEIAEAGFWRIGLTGEATETLARRSGRPRRAGARRRGRRHAPEHRRRIATSLRAADLA
jgi:23S rRNA (guanosine2251-2'-O)-methyltransferase